MFGTVKVLGPGCFDIHLRVYLNLFILAQNMASPVRRDEEAIV